MGAPEFFTHQIQRLLEAINAKLGSGSSSLTLASESTAGSAVPSKGQLVAGSDGTNARNLKTDASGELQVDVLSLPATPAGTNNIGDVDVASQPFADRSDTFTGTSNGTTVDRSTSPLQKFGIQVKGTGAAADAWSVVLEGSLDGTNFTTLLTHNAADGSLVTSGTARTPVKYFRSRVASLTLGGATNIVVSIIGMA